MKNKIFLAAVGAALAALAFQASAEQPFSAGYEDENQATGATLNVDRGSIGAPFVPYFGDENTSSWIYTAPPYQRKVRSGESASTGASHEPSWKPFVPYFGDENDASWVYAPRSR